jgi:hypothetical protein
MEMGTEVRLMASLAMEESVRPRVWDRPQNMFANWWQKGWETMRIPRLAFVLLIAAIVGLGSTFAVVQVRAHSNGSVVLLKVAWPGGNPIPCALSTQDKNQGCAFLGQIDGKQVGFEIDLIGRKGDGVELAVRTKKLMPFFGTHTLSEVRTEPQKLVYFEPGQTVKLDVPDVATLTMTGEWSDHVPVFLGASTQDVQAGPEELRLISPMLISDKQVLGDMQGGSAISDKADEGVAVSLPGQGRFLFALSPMRGAVQARVDQNRISFEEGARSYAFVTGSPVCRGEHLWVLHEANSKQDDAEHGAIGGVSAGEMRRLAPDVVINNKTTKN